MTTDAVVMKGAQGRAGGAGDLRLLGPWYAAVILNSYAATLFSAGCYDFADKELHAPAAVRLWMSALWGLAYIFISLMAGRVTERWGARRAIFVLTPLAAAASLLGVVMMGVPAGWGWAPWLLAGLMVPFNVTSSACWPVLESAISRCSGRMRLSTRMSFYNMAWAGAGFAAFFTRGALEQAWWGMVFVAPAAALLLCRGLLQRYAGGGERGANEPGNGNEEEEARLDTPELRRRAVTLLHMAWVGNALAYVGINVLLPVLMKLADESGVTVLAVAGFLTSVWGFTRLAGFFLAGKWTGWHYKARWLVGSQVALAGSFLLMMVVHVPWVLVLGQVVFGLSTALIYSSSLYYAMHTSEGSGGHAGLHEALIGVGICVGPAIGALAGGESVGSVALWRIGWSVSVVMIAGTVLMAMMGIRRPAATESTID